MEQPTGAVRPLTPQLSQKHGARLAISLPNEQSPLTYADSLNTFPAHIRLLHLHPGPSSSPITTTLQTVSLSSAPPYEALSYTWGAPKPTYPISVNDSTLGVTANLKLALFRLRDVEKTRLLWIDGICINQTDLVEKSFQVGLMREIYTRAANTVVWLGEEEEESDVALGLCVRMVQGWGNGFVKESFGIDIEAEWGAFRQENGETDEDAAMKEFAKGFDVEERVFQRFYQAGYDAVLGKEYEGPFKEKMDDEIRKAVGNNLSRGEEEILAMMHAGTLDAHFEAIGDRVAAGRKYDGLYKEIVYQAVEEEQRRSDKGTKEAVAKRNEMIKENVEEELMLLMMRNGTLEGFFHDAGKRVAMGEVWNGPFKKMVYEGYEEAMEELEVEKQEAAKKDQQVSAGAEDEGSSSRTIVEKQSPSPSTASTPSPPPVPKFKERPNPRFHESFVLQILEARQAAETSPTPKDEPTYQEITALHALFRRPWFRRIWIVQECGVSLVISIQCGSTSIDWWTFCFGFMITQKLNRVALLGPAHYKNIMLMSATRQSLQFALREEGGWKTEVTKPDLDLLQLLVKYRRYLATNQRDKIYALLGISQTSPESLDLVIDYEQDLESSYIGLAQGLLRTAANLDLLAVPQGNGEISTKLPLWVPDWSDTERMVYPLAGNHEAPNREEAMEALRVFTASGTSTADVTILPHNCIQLRGLLFDNITDIASVFHAAEDNLDLLNPANAGRTTSDIAALSFLKDLFAMFGSLPKVMKEWQSLARYDCEPTSYFSGTSKSTIRIRNAWKALAKVGVKSYRYPTGEDNFTVFARTLWTDMKTPAENAEEVRKYMSRVRDMEDMVRTIPSFDFEPTEENVAKFMRKTAPAQRKMKDANFMQGDVGCVHVLERRLARSGKGYLCLVPAETKVGDHIALLQGGATPFVLRSGAGGRTLVGECYVHGIMYGEAWDEEACGDVVLV